MKKEKETQNSEKTSRFSFGKGGRAVKKAVQKALVAREEKLAENDVIFTEPLTPAPEEAPKPLARGGVDVPFLVLALLLVCFGAVMSYSASAVFAQQRYDNSTYFLWRYLLFTLLAAVVTAGFVIFARPWFWRIFAAGSYAASIVLLIVVVFIGREGGGAERWIDLGFITIQPSEIAKMAVVMMKRRSPPPTCSAEASVTGC